MDMICIYTIYAGWWCNNHLEKYESQCYRKEKMFETTNQICTYTSIHYAFIYIYVFIFMYSLFYMFLYYTCTKIHLDSTMSDACCTMSCLLGQVRGPLQSLAKINPARLLSLSPLLSGMFISGLDVWKTGQFFTVAVAGT